MTLQRWRVALWLSMLTIVGAIVWQARLALIPFAFGAVLAYVFTPVVDRMAAVVPARSHQADVYRRGVAVLVLYLVLGAALVGAGLAIVPIAADQAAQFVEELPSLIEDSRAQLDDWLAQYRDRVPDEAQARFDGYVANASQELADIVEGAARRTVTVTTNNLPVLFGFVVVPFWMFYALRDRHRAGHNLLQAVPPRAASDVTNVLTIADQLLGRFLRAQLLLGLIVGTGVTIGLSLLDVQLALGLGIIAGITELIPIIGPWIGATPALLIVAATQPDLILWVALLYVAVQQLENNLLVPRVQGHAVDLHPAMIILLLVVAGAAFGLWGLIVIVPLTAILRELFWYADRRLRGVSAELAIAGSGVVRRNSRLRERLIPASPVLEPDPAPAEPGIEADTAGPARTP